MPAGRRGSRLREQDLFEDAHWDLVQKRLRPKAGEIWDATLGFPGEGPAAAWILTYYLYGFLLLWQPT